MTDFQDGAMLQLNGKLPYWRWDSQGKAPVCTCFPAGWHSCREDSVTLTVLGYPGLVGLYTKTEEITNGAPVWKGSQSANGKFVYLSTTSGSYGSWVIAESDDRSTWEKPSRSWVRRSRESGTWLQPANDNAVSVAVSCSTGSSAPKTILRCECPTITQNDENRSLVPYDAQRGCSAGAHILHNPVFFALCAQEHADIISHTLTTS